MESDTCAKTLKSNLKVYVISHWVSTCHLIAMVRKRVSLDSNHCNAIDIVAGDA